MFFLTNTFLIVLLISITALLGKSLQEKHFTVLHVTIKLETHMHTRTHMSEERERERRRRLLYLSLLVMSRCLWMDRKACLRKLILFLSSSCDWSKMASISSM